MSYVELYNENILDAINIGKSQVNFDTSLGDYIKVQVYLENSNVVRGTLSS